MDNTQTGLLEKQGDFDRLKKEAMWRSIIMEAHKDNLTRSAWCKKYHISEASFRRWEKYLIRKGKIKTNMAITHKQYKVTRVRKKDLWKQRILDAYNSDLNIKEWCEQNSVHASYICYLRKIFERSGDIPQNLADARKQRRRGERTSREEKIHCRNEKIQRKKEEKQRLKEEELSRKYENIVPVFCELPVPREYTDTNNCISKGATFKVGKFSLLAEEDVSEDMLCVALEALNTVMEVFEGDYRRS